MALALDAQGDLIPNGTLREAEAVECTDGLTAHLGRHGLLVAVLVAPSAKATGRDSGRAS